MTQPFINPLRTADLQSPVRPLQANGLAHTCNSHDPVRRLQANGLAHTSPGQRPGFIARSDSIAGHRPASSHDGSIIHRSRRPLAVEPHRHLITALLLFLTFTLLVSAQPSDDKQATFFMGRIKYSANDGDDCRGVGQELMRLVSRASTIKIQEERKVKLTDPELYETPFVFMNGHNEFVLTEAEVASLRKYLSHGGFFFASGCCTNPDFPKAWRREFGRIFLDEKVKPIPYDHLIYRSFYKIDRIRCLNEARDIQLEGLFYQGNLVAVMCEDGLCCAFSANNTCNRGKGVSPDDGQKLTLNIAVYALTH